MSTRDEKDNLGQPEDNNGPKGNDRPSRDDGSPQDPNKAKSDPGQAPDNTVSASPGVKGNPHIDPEHGSRHEPEPMRRSSSGENWSEKDPSQRV